MPTENLPIVGHRDASEYLRDNYGIVRSAATFAKYSCCGCPGGVERPRFKKAGRDVVYARAELDAFAALGPRSGRRRGGVIGHEQREDCRWACQGHTGGREWRAV
jgi:hypothetical protein